ncbi:protein NUCLEAR FUSION DEFECTIVE 4-like [Vitis riparia]|uniref:protein NUCLEAR FUSION DEFECTIVE 4-like n=1 Tax=Vitis riparia TaxID=96939 RepID=UPI00155AB1E7|nr:protein NUCLEAR FUSION DEFECTIVE 4-like [Vitis riparia]
MVGESRRWMILVATTWIQAFTGTNLDFSSYSSHLKSVLGISQLQLNYLSVASDLGKAFGWCCGVSLLYLPLCLLLFMAAFMGLLGYGLQWLLIQRLISLPYVLVFLICLLAGCSISWFNTLCYVLCIQHFPSNRPLALSLTTGFNGVSAALYTLIANAINPHNDSLYLSLNALVPLVISTLALVPILRQPPPQNFSSDTVRSDSLIFLLLNGIAVFTGLYLLLLDSLSYNTYNVSVARILLGGAILLLVLPLSLPGIIYSHGWAGQTSHSSSNMGEVEFLELQKELIGSRATNMSFNSTSTDDYPTSMDDDHSTSTADYSNDIAYSAQEKQGCCEVVTRKDQLMRLGEEHPAWVLVRRWDFWLYYIAYLCGGTIGLAYSNNLGQISESLGYSSETNTIVTLYSACSFFGRLLSAAPDFLKNKVYFARTGWLAVALLPTPLAFFWLALSGSKIALHAGTGLIGLSSGFVFAAAVSITSELFGPNSTGVNHNILITNIPLGSLLYGLLAALVYDSNIESSKQKVLIGEAMVCMGRQCYQQTFFWWACISLLGLACSFSLFLRTRPAYDHFERNRKQRESEFF